MTMIILCIVDNKYTWEELIMFTASLNGAVAVQRAIDITTQNITNAGTPGYHRVEAQFRDLPVMSGSTSQAQRMEDPLLEYRYRTAMKEYSTNQAVSDATSDLVGVFDNSSLKQAYQDFVSATNDFAKYPTNESVFKAAGENFSNTLQDFGKRLDQVEQQLKKNIDYTDVEIENINREIQRLQNQPDSDAAKNQISNLQLQVGVLAGKRDGLVSTLGEVYPPVKKIFDDTYNAFKDKVNSSYGKDLFGEDKSFNYQTGDIINLNNSLDNAFEDGYISAQFYAGMKAHGAEISSDSSNAIKMEMDDKMQKASGVDTATELIKMEQYKQQYEAIMKTIAAKDSMIGSLLAIV